MAYEVEDEIDWSDSPLDPPSPAHLAPVPASVPTYRGPTVTKNSDHEQCLIDFEVDRSREMLAPASVLPRDIPTMEDESHNYDSLFELDTPEELNLPLGVPLNLNTSRQNNNQPTLSRAQRASLGVHLNRRIPSKEDYAHFALYQANQRAYEATFLKSFVAYALHSDRIAKCFSGDAESHRKIEEYLEAVSANVNHVANKMVWNAHCRTVNLLANDGKDGAPFLDVHTFSSDVFSDFDPNKTAVVARKMNESWHRAIPIPTMVRLSTREYPIGYHTSPLEELDEVVDTIFHKDNFGTTLPTGRPAKAPGKTKGKGRDLPGAVAREEQSSLSRGNWLAFPSMKPVVAQHSPPPVVPSCGKLDYNMKLFEPDGINQQNLSHTVQSREETINNNNLIFEPDSDNESQFIQDLIFEFENEPQLIQDLRSEQYSHVSEDSAPESSYASSSVPAANSTQPEVLFNRYGPESLHSDHISSASGSEIDHLVEKVPALRKWLVKDHKRRLTARWGNPPTQALRNYLPGIKDVISQAIAMGLRPSAEDYQERVEIIAAREREKLAPVHRSKREDMAVLEVRPSIESASHHAENGGEDMLESQPGQMNVILESSKRKGRKQKTSASALPLYAEASLSLQEHLSGPRKSVSGIKRKTSMSQTKKSKQKISMMEPPKKKKKVAVRATQNDTPDTPAGPHPSGSQTLELHQILPPDAYFEPTSIDEEPAWRCGSNHAMGHYYNAGRRKNCRGCNVSLSDNTRRVVMDFYLPSRSFFYQPAPGMKWKPCKPLAKARKSNRPCHNSIAKDAYWEAIAANWTEDEARQHGIAAVTEYLKPKPPKEPTPEPTPEPQPDLGPHPSGSITMEHGQDLPECAYSEQQEEDEEFAWRCDVNHALGRYYLAGDKKSCPGCGTNKNGKGKQTVLDFYMPSGVVVRQEAPHLVKWKPRKYKMRKASSGTKKEKTTQHYSHNQICTELYLQAIAVGLSEENALAGAIETTDKYLNEQNQEADIDDNSEEEGQLEQSDDEGQKEGSTHTRQRSITPAQAPSPVPSNNTELTSTPHSPDTYRRNSHGGCTVSLIPQQRDFSDVEVDEYELYKTEKEVVVISSDEEESSSGSDSE